MGTRKKNEETWRPPSTLLECGAKRTAWEKSEEVTGRGKHMATAARVAVVQAKRKAAKKREKLWKEAEAWLEQVECRGDCPADVKCTAARGKITASRTYPVLSIEGWSATATVTVTTWARWR